MTERARLSGAESLGDRYGTPAPRGRRVVVLVSGLVAVVALAWLGWAAWFQGTPEVQSSLRSFEILDVHTVEAVVTVKPRSAQVDADCLVRAFGEDHSVVGEQNFAAGSADGALSYTVTVRTEREATSVELVGCTAPGQSRPR